MESNYSYKTRLSKKRASITGVYLHVRIIACAYNSALEYRVFSYFRFFERKNATNSVNWVSWELI